MICSDINHLHIVHAIIVRLEAATHPTNGSVILFRHIESSILYDCGLLFGIGLSHIIINVKSAT